MQKSKKSVLAILSAEEKEYPFKRAPLIKIDGQTLLSHLVKTINRISSENIEVVILCRGTDDEVLLQAQRLGVSTVVNSYNRNNITQILNDPEYYHYTHIALFSFFHPFFDSKLVSDLIKYDSLSSIAHLVSVSSNGDFFSGNVYNRIASIVYLEDKNVITESSESFIPVVEPYTIYSIHDLWKVEHLRKRKKIVFHVEAYKSIGMGHIYRCLSVAGHLLSFEIEFIASRRSKVIPSMLNSYGFKGTIVDSQVAAEDIIKLNPDLVINDVLNTNKDFITKLKAHTRVVNFEDLGEGAAVADITINDLYTEGESATKNIYWGPEFYFLRDEFESAVQREWRETVSSILITFGGTDPNNLTLKVLTTIKELCIKRKIKMNIVTGTGYTNIVELEEEISKIPSDLVDHIHRTGVMSSIMENSDIAICSNGRTTFELAHMNIPAIVVCHHEREALHSFAREENGFINIGVFQGEKSLFEIEEHFLSLLTTNTKREKLFNNMKDIDFKLNKQRVVKLITGLLEEK